MFKLFKIELKTFILITGMLTASFSFGQENQNNEQQSNGDLIVNDSELEEFAKVFQHLQLANQEIQQEMITVIKEESMEVAVFNTIHKAKMQDQKADASKADLAKYKAVVASIDELQVDFQSRMKDIITENGLTVERYQEIVSALQKDSQLQERLKNILAG